MQQLLEEQETIHTLETRLAESDDALTAAAEEVAALRQLNGGERPSSSMQSVVEELHERVWPSLLSVPLPDSACFPRMFRSVPDVGPQGALQCFNQGRWVGLGMPRKHLPLPVCLCWWWYCWLVPE